MTWLITLTRNLATDKLRAPKSSAVDTDNMPEIVDSGPTPEAAAIAASERAQIDLCLDELEVDRFEAVRDAYLEGGSYQDLADRYGVSLNTMGTSSRRSLLKLKDCLSR